MASEWSGAKFGACAKRVRDVVQPDTMGGNTPYIGLEHIVEGGLHLSGHSTASEATSAKTRFRQGDILFGKLRPYFRKVVRTAFDGICSTDIWAVRAENGVDQGFLFYRMASQEFIDISMGASKGTHMPRADWSFLANWDFPLPSPAEQRAIAGVLGALDDKIEQNRRTARALERLARAIFRAWFVDFEPVKAKAARAASFPSMPQPVFDALPTRFVDSAIGPVPEGWEAGTLGDIARQHRAGVQPSEIDPETPYIGLEHMPRRSIALTEWEHAGKVSSGKARFSTGQILFGKLRPYFHKIGIAPIDGVCSTDIVVMEPKAPEWLSIVLGHASSDEFVAHTTACSSGTKMPRTNWKDMAAYPIALPPLPLAEMLTGLVGPMYDLIRSGIFESRKLVAMRDYLLPKLLSGQVRVSQAERVAEEAV